MNAFDMRTSAIDSRGRHAFVRLAPTLLVFGSALGVFASCAKDDDTDGGPDAGTQILEEAGSADGATDATDGADSPPPPPCDADDPTCTTELLDCAEVDWCAVPTDVGAIDLLTSVWGSSKDDVWAVGSGGSMTHYDGQSWKRTPPQTMTTFFGVWGSGPNDVWAVSDTQTIMHSDGWKDGTASWTRAAMPIPVASKRMTYSIWGFGPTDVRIGGEAYLDENSRSGNMFLKEANGETSWAPVLNPGNGTILGIWGSSPEDVWMVVDNSKTVTYERGQTLHGTPAGTEPTDNGDPLVWSTVDSQSTVTLRGVWGSSASDVWSVGDAGTIRRIHAGETRWSPALSPTTERLRGIWGTGPDDVWIVGDYGTILHYDGTRFTRSTGQFALGKNPNLWSVWGSSANDVWIVGDGIALHYTGAKERSRSDR